MRFSMMKFVPALLVSLFWLHGAVQVVDTNGISHTPLRLHDHQAAVFIFVATDCPISNSYAPAINRMVEDCAKEKLDFYVVYSDPHLSLDDAKKHAKAYGYTCPALLDTQQMLKKKLNATATPEAIVVDPHGKVLYQGRIDNWYEAFGKQRYSPTTHELRDALDDIIAGKKVSTPLTKVVGCPI